MSESAQRTVIVGGGFTGLFTALYLSHLGYVGQVVLIDPAERFVFKPLLYELLNGQMNADQVWPSYEELLQDSGVTFVQDSVEHIDLTKRQIELASGLHYTYTHMVLALGSTTGYFETPGAQEYSFSFRSGQDVLALRQHLRSCLQTASQTDDPELRRQLLTVGIVGAGATGIELSLTLADWLPDWYAELGGNPQEIRVVVINRGPHILSGDANEGLRETALQAMRQRKVPVQLLTGAPVTALSPGRVEFTHLDERGLINAQTIVWTAGTATHPLVKNLPIPEEQRDKHGRPLIVPTLHLMGYPEVFAGGDCVTLLKPQPALAQVAYQHAKAIAHNLVNISAGEVPRVGHVSLRGTLMKLGSTEGAANIFDKYLVKGNLGHKIRHLTYLEMLPTPVHDLKITAEWLNDEIFRRAESSIGYQSRS